MDPWAVHALVSAYWPHRHTAYGRAVIQRALEQRKPSAPDAADRLREWIEAWSEGRYGRPTYANPRVMASDLTVVLDELHRLAGPGEIAAALESGPQSDRRDDGED